MRRAVLAMSTMVILSWLVTLSNPVEAAPAAFDFDRHVVDELARPNVRMVAVVFSASWCEPCLAEEEEWRRIKAIYGPRGLRLVVVRYRDAAGRMKVYDWPDHELWDDNGRVGEAFEIGMELPAAFLWSWDGRLLARKKTAQEVVSRINDYLVKSPRVLVEATEKDGETPLPPLQALVESELMRLGKFDVVVNQADRKRMEQLRRASHAPNRSDRERCKLGLEMSPNSLVTATPMGRNLLVSLKDIERACLVQSVATPINPNNPPGTVAEGVAALVASLRINEVESPGIRRHSDVMPPPVIREQERAEGGEVDQFAGADSWYTVLLRSNPPGASVRLEEVPGQVKRPDAGEHVVRWRLEGGRSYTAVFEMPLYKPERIAFQVGKNRREVFGELKEDFGELSLFSEPSGLDLFINGAQAGKTPLAGKRIQAKESIEVEVKHPCFKPYRITGLQVKAGERREERMKLVPRLALVEVVLTDTTGHLKGGVVYADGHRLGSTDDKHRVSICARKLKVVPNDGTLGSWEQDILLEAGEIREFSVTVNDRKHAAKVEAKRSERDRLIEDEIAAFYYSMDFGQVEETGLDLVQLTSIIQPWAWEQRSVFTGVAVTLGEETTSAEWVLGYQWWATTWFAPYIRGQIGHSKTAPNELAMGTEAGCNLYFLKDVGLLRSGVKWSHEHGVYGFVGFGASWSILGWFF